MSSEAYYKIINIVSHFISFNLMSNLLIQEIYFLKQVKPYIMYLENNSLYTFY